MKSRKSAHAALSMMLAAIFLLALCPERCLWAWRYPDLPEPADRPEPVDIPEMEPVDPGDFPKPHEWPEPPKLEPVNIPDFSEPPKRSSSKYSNKQVVEAVRKLKFGDEEARLRAIQVLRNSGDVRSLYALIGALNDPSESVLKAVIKALGRMGDVRAVEPLKQLRDRSDGAIREQCIRALRRLGSSV